MAFDLQKNTVTFVMKLEKYILPAAFLWLGIVCLLSTIGVNMVEHIGPDDQWHGDEYSRYLNREWRINPGYRFATYAMWSSIFLILLLAGFSYLKKRNKSY